MPLVFRRYRVYLAAVLLLWTVFSCKKAPEKSVHSIETPEASASDAFLSIESTAYPAWFEFSGNGLQPIKTPASASLRSFEPWPYAYRLAGSCAALNYVSMGINRYGFISAVNKQDGSVSFYLNNKQNDFGTYSIAGIFRYKGAPTALLYRDRFFLEPDTPVPSERVFSLEPDAQTLIPVYPAAFKEFAGADGWEIHSLGLGSNDLWYFRAFKKNDNGGEQVYCVSSSLDTEPEQTDVGRFRTALKPSNSYPAAVKASFASMASWFDDTEVHAVLHAPQLEAAQEILLAAGTKGPLRLSAYTDAERTLILLPDGRGLIRTESVQTFTLPSLPENYVYTTILLLGSTMIVSWEEQKSWAVGAAGLLLCTVP